MTEHIGPHGPAYPKAQNLWARDPETHKITPGVFRQPEMDLIKHWVVTEKIDGMNMRLTAHAPVEAAGFVGDDDRALRYAGRTNRAVIPKDLIEWIESRISWHDVCQAAEILELPAAAPITLYGEGYGGKIQKGHGYGDEKKFILFDVRVGFGQGGFLSDAEVSDFAKHLGIERAPIISQSSTIEQINTLVWAGFQSRLEAEGEDKPAEGVMCRPALPMYDRYGQRIQFKLKTDDLR